MKLSDELRKSVLQYAIQGKITSHEDSDSSVDIALDEIRKKAPIYKSCKTPLIYDSMNFEIPNYWKMVELNSIFDFVDYRGKTPTKVKEGVFLITATNIKKGYMDYTRKEYITPKEYSERQSRGITECGDLLFTTEAPMGNAAICDLDKCSCGQRIITFKPYISKYVNNELFMYFILSPAFQQQLLDNCTGATAKGIKADKLKHFLIPFPPIEEQNRIVEKLKKVFIELDETNNIEDELILIQNKFPKDFRNSVIRSAMNGELNQHSTDIHAIDKYIDKINQTNRNIVFNIKNKNIKKDIELVENGFLPSNWKCTKLGEVVFLDNGLKQKGSEANYLEVRYLRTNSNPVKKDSGEFISKGDYAILVDGENSGEVFQMPESGYLGSTFKKLIINECFNTKYVLYFILLYKDYLRDNKKGAAIPHLNKTIFNDLELPIPPIEEQNAIVEKLDELLPLCNELEQL